MAIDPRAWGLETPLPGTAQQDDLILAFRASLGAAASAPMTVANLLAGLTSANITAALGGTPVLTTGATFTGPVSFAQGITMNGTNTLSGVIEGGTLDNSTWTGNVTNGGTITGGTLAGPIALKNAFTLNPAAIVYSGQTASLASSWDVHFPSVTGTLGNGGTITAPGPNYMRILFDNDSAFMNNAQIPTGLLLQMNVGNGSGGRVLFQSMLKQTGPMSRDPSGKQPSISIGEETVSLNNTWGGTAMNDTAGLVYGRDRVVAGPGAEWLKLINGGNEGDVAITPSKVTLTIGGDTSAGGNITIRFQSTAFALDESIVVPYATGELMPLICNYISQEMNADTALRGFIGGGISPAIYGATSDTPLVMQLCWPTFVKDLVVTITVTGSLTVTQSGFVSGGSAEKRYAKTFVLTRNGGSSGWTNDAVIGLGYQSHDGTPMGGGWKGFVDLGAPSFFDRGTQTFFDTGQFPFDPSAILFKSTIPTSYGGAYDAAFPAACIFGFLDMRNINTSRSQGIPFQTSGWSVFSEGSQQIGSASLQRLSGSASLEGLKISANGWACTSYSISNGGGASSGTPLIGRYFLNQIVVDSNGGQWNIDGVGSLGDITLISPTTDQFGRPNLPVAPPGAAPASVQLLFGGSGSGTGAALTMVWTQGNTIQIGGVGQMVALQGTTTASVMATGGATLRTLSDRAADVINVKDLGAKGDGGQYTSTFAILSGTPHILTATDPVFANAIAGMTIGVPNAGATGTTGRCTALPSVSGGDGYTGIPTITLSGSPTEAATILVFMGVKAATLTSGGTGGPANSTVTLNIATVTAVVPVQLSVTTDGSGNITGTPTVLAGQWAGRFPVLTGNPAVGSPFAVAPVFTLNIQVDHYGVGGLANTISGYGSGYALTGITASISGGSPGTAAVPGVPVITPYIQTLGTTIASVQSSTQVTLTAAATTTLNQSETIAYGTDDTAAIQAAVNVATVKGAEVYFPNSIGFYLTDKINLVDHTTIVGPGQLGMSPASNNPMFDAGTHAHITIKNINGLGNRATCLNPNSGSCFLVASPGASDINALDNRISGWTRHGISVDGISGGKFCRNTIDHIYYGAGIILSSTVVSSAVIADSNTVSFTQFAGIEAGFVGLIGGSITSNSLVSCGNNGYGDSTSGHTSDGLTGYTASSSNELTVVANNTIINAGNNGIHWGGKCVLIANNTIKTPFGSCIFLGAFPNSAPPELSDNRVIGNHCTGLDRTNPVNTGISVRNMLGAVIMGNTVTNCYDGVETYGFTSGTGCRDITITGNEFNTVTIGVWLRHKTQYSYVGGNIFLTAAVGIQIDNNPVTGDGSFPSFTNTIDTNLHDSVTIPVVEANGTNFNTINYQAAVNGSGTTNTIIGSQTIAQSPSGALQTFSTPGTYNFYFPPYATSIRYMVISAGASGANGHAQASGTSTSGGAGGSAGGVIPPGGGFKTIPTMGLTSPITVVVGAGGASPSGDGAQGNAGGQSSFGADIVFGGGQSSGGAASTNSASGGSGNTIGAGHNASGTTAGTATATNWNVAGVSGAAGNAFAFGGASGGGSISTGAAGTAGGASSTGPAGGGAGGGLAAIQVGLNGGAGGQVLPPGTTAAAGGVSGTNNGDAPAVTALHAGPGKGAGGGASQVNSRGGNGAAGVDGSGGGGGGSGGTGQTVGIGGQGGDGLVMAGWA